MENEFFWLLRRKFTAALYSQFRMHFSRAAVSCDSCSRPLDSA